MDIKKEKLQSEELDSVSGGKDKGFDDFISKEVKNVDLCNPQLKKTGVEGDSSGTEQTEFECIMNRKSF